MTTADEWSEIGLADVEQIGRGGFGVVYKAVESDLGRTVAVKVLPGELDERSRDRFDRERRAMAVLSDHPHIVPIFRSGFMANGQPYLVMEHVSGGSMADRLESGPVPWQQVVRLGVELAGALETAHRSGVLHRDVKPGNILLSALGSAKLADFGIARLHGAPETRSASVTASVAHAPPEVVAGQRPDQRSDTYSLASTLFELLTGSPPFVRPTDESLVPVLARIAQDPVPDLRDRGVPASVCQALEQGMAKDPSDRPQQVADLGRSLQMAERDEGLPVSELLVVGEAAALPSDSDLTTDLGSIEAVPTLPPTTGSTPSVTGLAGTSLPTPTSQTAGDDEAPTTPQPVARPEPAEPVTAPQPVAATETPFWKRPAVLAGAAGAVLVVVIGLAVSAGGGGGGEDDDDEDLGLGTVTTAGTDPGPTTTPDTVITTPDTVVTTPPDTGPLPTQPPPTEPPPTTPTLPDRTPPDLGGLFGGGGTVDTTPAPPPGGTVRVTDDTGAISLEVPTAWSDVSGAVADGAASLIAAPNIDGALNTFTTPGILIQIDQLQPGLTVDGLLDLFAAETEGCVSGGRQPFALGDFAGQYELFGSCDGTITVISTVVMFDNISSTAMLIVSQAVAPEDIGAIGVALETLVVNASLVP
ncbi:MAG: protein kinase [Actinomycetota bacterium]